MTKSSLDPVNLASLPRDAALQRAFDGGRDLLRQEGALSPVWRDLRHAWITENIPNACGQSDDEFDGLIGEACGLFDAGLTEAMHEIQTSGQTAVSDDAKETMGQLSALLMLMSSAHDEMVSLPTPEQLLLTTLARDLCWSAEKKLGMWEEQ